MALLFDTLNDFSTAPTGTSDRQKLSDYADAKAPSYSDANQALNYGPQNVPPAQPEWLGMDPRYGSMYKNPDGSYWSASTGTVTTDPRTQGPAGPQEPGAQPPAYTPQQPAGIQPGQQWLGDNTPLGTVWKNPDGSFWSTATGTVNQDELLSQWDKEVAQQAATQLGPTEASQQDYYKLRPPTSDMAQPTGNIQSITPEQATEFRNKFNAENPPQEDWWKPISGLVSNVGSGLKDIGAGLYSAVEGTKEANPEQVLGGASQISTGTGETLGAPVNAAGRLGATAFGTVAAGLTGAVEAQRQLVNALGADVKPIDYGVSPEDILHPGRTGQQFQTENVQPVIEMIRNAPIPDALGGSKTADYLATAAEIGVNLSENPITYMSPAAASAAEKLSGMGLQGRVAAKVLSFIGDQGDAASQLVAFEAGGLAMKAAQDAGITDEGALTAIALGAGGLALHFKAHELGYEEAALNGLDKLRDSPIIQRAIQQYKEAPESGEFRFRTAKPEEPVVEPVYTITPRKYEDVPVGTGGIESALDIAKRQVQQKGDIAKGIEDIPVVGRGLNAIANAIDPGINMTPDVKTAQAAAVGGRANLTTEYITNTRRPVEDFYKSIQEDKPIYIGPRAESPAQQALHFTTADIFERPSMYALSDKQLAALRALDDTNWRNSSDLKSKYGVDISPYHVPDPNGGYIPHVPSKESAEAKFESASRDLVGAGGGGIAKEREFPTLYDRVLANPDFKPETDIRELTRIHNESLARMGSMNILKAGVGGKTWAEVVEERKPGLIAERQRTQELINNLESRLDTQRKQFIKAETLNNAAQSELGKQVDRRDSLLARISDRASANADSRSAAKTALAESRAALTDARNEALAAARETGKAGTPRAANRELENLIAKAKNLDDGIAKAQNAIDISKLELGSMEAKPPVGITKAEVKAFWDQAHAVQQNLIDAVSMERNLTRAGLKIPVGEAASRLERATVAQGAAKESASGLRSAENQAIRSSAESAKESRDTVLAGMNAKAKEIEQRINDSIRKLRGNNSIKGTAQKMAENDAMITGLKSSLADLKSQMNDLNKKYRLTASGDYKWNDILHQWVLPKVNDEVNSLYNRGGKNWQLAINISDELRGFHLAGDASPFTIQGMLGILSDPVTAAHMFYHAVTTARPRQELFRLAREEPDMVAEYTRSTGIPFAAHGTEEFTTRKGVGHFAPIGRSEDYMFDVLSLAKYHMWQNDRNLLLKMNKGMDPHVASMDAAHLGALTIPSLNPTERFVSPERRGIERIGFTSLSFATTPAILTKDAVSGIAKAASSGIAKIITSRKVDPAEIWGSMSGREQLAVIHMAELAGSLSAIAAGSAALAASSRNMSPEDAIKEAFDPNSRYFLALQLGGGHSIPLGGPFRSFVKAFTPNRDGVWGPNALQFARGKFNAPVSTPIDILRNSDFTGKNIYSGNATAPENIGKILAYLAENAVPLSAGQVLTDLRTGDLNKGTIERVGGQLIGGNLNPPTDYETAQENMRSQYENYNPVLIASDGKKVNYTKPEDLNDDPLFVKRYAIEHPRDPSSDVGKAIDAVVNRNIEGSPGREAMQNNAAAAADKITLGQWKETRKEINHTIRYELGKATEGIDKGPAEPGTPRYWLDSYYKTFEEATSKDTGQLDTELLDQKQAEWLKANGPQALDYVHEYAQVGKDPIEKEYLAAMAKLGDEGYFSSGPNAIPRYISKVSQLSDKEIMELHDKASTAHTHEEKYQNIKSPDTAILLWMTEHGHSPAEILDVQNAGKKSKEAPQRTMYKALNKKLLTWLDPNAYYSQTK